MGGRALRPRIAAARPAMRRRRRQHWRQGIVRHKAERQQERGPLERTASPEPRQSALALPM